MGTLTAEVAASRGVNKYGCHGLPMKNGRWRVALVAGGPADVARDVRAWLAQTRNTYVKYHLEAQRTREWQKPIPEDVDFVILLRDYAGHPDFIRIKEACKRSGTPYILTQRKKSTMATALLIRGIQAGAPIPVEVSSMAFFHDPEPVKLKVVTADQPSGPEARAEPAQKELLDDRSPSATVVPTSAEGALGGTQTAPPTPQASPWAFGALPQVNLVVEQAAIPAKLPERRPGVPSPQLAAVAAALQALCAQDSVTVLISPTELTINPYRER